MNTRVSYSLTKDGTLHLFGERMKDFDNLEDRPWHNFSQYIRRIELIVERIGNHAFEGCKSLVEVTIKGHGPEIGDSAFENCASLTHFSGPTILRSIGKRAFYNCVALKDSIDAYTIDDYAFFNCKSMKVYNCVRKASIIGKHAFEKCNSINREGLNWANESVCDYAYANCSQLTSFSFGPDTRQIGNNIFYGCSNLKKVSIPRKFNDSIFQIIGFTGIEIDYF